METANIYDHLAYLYKEREDIHRTEKAHTARIKSRLRKMASLSCEDHSFKCPRCKALADEWYAGKGDEAAVMAAKELNAPWIVQFGQMHALRLGVEKEMVAAVADTCVYPFVETVRGLGPLGLALILGETGDLRGYANPAKVWKRMGLAVFDGKSQRRTTNAEEAIRQGYNPSRRSLMYVIGAAIVKQGDEYRQVYLDRKAYELERNPEMTKMHAHRRAQRYMEKRLLRNLWRYARAEAA